MVFGSKMNSPAAETADFRYWAFISYSSRDEEWAKWLHRRLEGFVVPARIAGRDLPPGPAWRRLRPVFRDRDELSSSADLGGQIRAALAASRRLIVVCSPRAAASQWVDAEVLEFKRLGRAQDIYCLVVDGEPNASLAGRSEAECFCPSLRFALGPERDLGARPVEPLAADARAAGDGRAGALLKLIAGMLGIGFDELRQRHRARRRRNLAAWAAAAAIVSAAGSVGAWVVLDRIERAHLSEQARLGSLRAADTVGALIEAEDYEAALAQLAGHLPRSLERPERPLVPALLAHAKRLKSEFGLRQVLWPCVETASAGAKPEELRCGRPIFVLSPDGDRLVAGAADHAIELWDLALGRRIAELARAPNRLVGDNDVSFSPDGKWIAIDLSVEAPEAGVLLFRAEDGGRQSVQEAPTALSHISFGPNDLAVVGFAESSEVRVVHLTDRRTVSRFSGPVADKPLFRARFDPAGRRIAAAFEDYSQALVFRVEDGALVSAATGHDGFLWQVEFVDEGRAVLSVSSGGRAAVTDAETGHKLFAFEFPKPQLSVRVSLSLDAKRAILHDSFDGPSIWSLETGKMVDAPWAKLSGSAKAFFLPGGDRILILAQGMGRWEEVRDSPAGPPRRTYRDTPDRIVDARTGNDIVVFEETRRTYIENGALSPDGRSFVGSHEAGTFVWSTETGRRIRRLSKESGAAKVAFSDDGRLILASLGPIVVWDRDPAGALRRADAGLTTRERGSVIAARLTPDGGTVVLLRGLNPHLRIRLGPPSEVAPFGMPTPDFSGKIAEDGTVGMTANQPVGSEARLFSPRWGSGSIMVKTPPEPIGNFGLSPNGAVAYTVHGPTLRENSVLIWNTETGEKIAQLGTWRYGVAGAVISHDSRRIAVKSVLSATLIGGRTGPDPNSNVEIFDLESGRRVVVLDGAAAADAFFDGSGKRMATADLGGGFTLWDAETGRRIRDFRASDIKVKHAEFDRGGRRLAVVAQDEIARVYALDGATPPLLLRGHVGSLRAAHFVPGDKHLLTLGSDDTLRLWDIETGVAVAVLRARPAFDAHFDRAGRRVLLVYRGAMPDVWDAAVPDSAEALAWVHAIATRLRQVQ
jgi:WD40 repeat protein